MDLQLLFVNLKFYHLKIIYFEIKQILILNELQLHDPNNCIIPDTS